MFFRYSEESTSEFHKEMFPHLVISDHQQMTICALLQQVTSLQTDPSS